ncbi:MAG: PKD domain-containing protein, partial [Bacteroidota bacterium]|nr:PKD domain-containing protein [Bacteroidota bacterium]
VERGPNNCGGRTRTLLVDKNDPSRKTVWAGAVAGGLWKTTDITQAAPNWTPFNDFFQNLAITHIDQAPNNGQVMYFCTGEGNNNLDAVRGLGVWKSSNGGNTWAQLNSTNNSNFYFCQKIVSIGNGDTVLVLTKTGLYRSSNGGNTFTKVLGSGIASAGGNIAYDLEVMKNGTMYVTMSGGTTNGGTMHKSFNTGINWTNPLSLPSYMNKDEMEIAVADNDTNVIYSLVESGGRIVGIIKSSNAGVSFDTTASHPIDADGGVSQPAFIKDFSRGQGWYDLSLAVDPNNTNVVVVGGVDLFKTSNGGASWQQLSHWYGGFGYQEVHADQHYVCFEPGNSNVCYFTNDGGMYISSNFTQGGPAISSKEINYNSTQFYACDIHPNAGSNQYLGGTQDNGSHALNSPLIGSSIEVTGGDGAFCHIDQDQPQFWFTSYVYTRYYRSTNGGASFAGAISTAQNIGSFISPSDYDDTNNKMYLAGNNGFFVRWDNPQTGNSLIFDTVPAFNNGRITHVKVSPNTNNRVYFGLNNGRVVRVDNAHILAGIETHINNGVGMPTTSVSCIEVEEGNENHVVVTYSNYGVNSVWETKNGGSSWTSIEGNLPDMPIRWALFNPNKNWQMMLATELGVWTSDSLSGSSTNWQPSNSGFANVRTDMLKMRGFDKQVVAATHGRGMFTSNVFMPPSADFYVDKKVAYISSILQFTNTSVGALSYQWNFGDGTFSTAQNPSKQYFAPGFYTVTLQINGGAQTKTYNSYIQILPYRQVPYLLANGGNFETNPNDFGPDLITGTGFIRGSSTTAGKNGVNSGSNAWVTGLVGNYANNSNALLYSPNFNCTAAGTYTLRFRVKNRFEVGYDGYRVEYSTNLGNTWTRLGNSVQTNWYDFANGTTNTAFPRFEPYFNANNTAFNLKQIDVSFLAGNPKVAFRWVFKSDAGVTEAGMALDDVELLGPANTALPVSLLQFTGSILSEEKTQLNWLVGNEKNNAGFEIEKSEDGISFYSIGFVKGKINNEQTSAYRFVDENATEPKRYYRLKQKDLNGSENLSKTLYFEGNKATQKLFQLAYQSAENKLHIACFESNLSYKLFNQSGQLVQSGRIENDMATLPLENLAKGIYLLEISNQMGNKQVEKILNLNR